MTFDIVVCGPRFPVPLEAADFVVEGDYQELKNFLETDAEAWSRQRYYVSPRADGFKMFWDVWVIK